MARRCHQGGRDSTLGLRKGEIAKKDQAKSGQLRLQWAEGVSGSSTPLTPKAGGTPTLGETPAIAWKGSALPPDRCPPAAQWRAGRGRTAASPVCQSRRAAHSNVS